MSNFPKLTDEEAAFIEETQRCPDCRVGALMEGPSAGMMVNVKCSHCASEFNLNSESVSMSHRLPRTDSPTSGVQSPKGAA